MRFLKIILCSFLILIVTMPIVVIVTLLGQKSTFNEIAQENDISSDGFIDISSKAAEQVILNASDDEYFFPLSVQDMKRFLELEKETYSDSKITKTRTKVEIENDEVLEREVISEEELDNDEYRYRVPWQLIGTINFLSSEDYSNVTKESLMSEIKYILPSIKFDDNYNLNSNGGNYATYFREERTEKIVKKYDRSGKSYKFYDKDETVERKIIYDKQDLLISLIETPFKTVRYNYQKNIIRDELVDEYSSTKVHRDKDKNITGKTVKTTKKYVTIAELIPEEIEEKNSSRYDEFLKKINLYESKNDVLQFTSLMAGGIDSVGEMMSAYDNTETFIISDIYFAGLNISDIQITPEELLLPIPRFSQLDTRWSRIPYGNSTIGIAGCGPTAMSMVLTGLTKEIISPVEMAYFSANNGYKVKEGTAWGFFSAAAQKYGYSVEQLSPREYSKLLENLKNGQVAIAAMGSGHFTRNGHFIVLVGISDDGIIVNDSYDPNGVKNREWDPRIIFSEASQYFIITKGA